MTTLNIKSVDLSLSNKRVFYRPEQYLKFLKTNKTNVKNVVVKPPKLGAKHFGVIEVEVKK